jgi:hypothetical protein
VQSDDDEKHDYAADQKENAENVLWSDDEAFVIEDDIDAADTETSELRNLLMRCSKSPTPVANRPVDFDHLVEITFREIPSFAQTSTQIALHTCVFCLF